MLTISLLFFLSSLVLATLFLGFWSKSNFILVFCGIVSLLFGLSMLTNPVIEYNGSMNITTINASETTQVANYHTHNEYSAIVAGQTINGIGIMLVILGIGTIYYGAVVKANSEQ